MRNRYRVPTKQWRKWSAKARSVFNRVYSFIYDNPDLMNHPAAPKPKAFHWKTVAWKHSDRGRDAHAQRARSGAEEGRMSHPLNLVRRRWRPIDMIPRFPRRAPTVPAASWLEELMAKRFGALILDAHCAWKYRDALRRFGYVRHPDMKARGTACDACKQVASQPVPLWFKEEHRYPTQQDYAGQSAHAGIRSAPHAYDGQRRVLACSQ